MLLLVTHLSYLPRSNTKTREKRWTPAHSSSSSSFFSFLSLSLFSFVYSFADAK